MAFSAGSSETSLNSRPADFSFSSQFSTSFTDLIHGVGDDNEVQARSRFPQASRGLSCRAGGRLAGGGVPKFKSVPPPSLPISPKPISPSAYFAIPAGISPTELLDSPVLLSSSQVLPSPTTGTFPTQSFNWKANSGRFQQQGLEDEDEGFSDFFFQTHPSQRSTSASIFFQNSSGPKHSEEAFRGIQQQTWNHQEAATKSSEFSAPNPNINPAPIASKESTPPDFSSVQGERRRLDDGFNWKKYGQKQVKGSENPRSYYKCTHPNCPTKKMVETNLEGVITEIVYKSIHNHPKPQSTRRNSSSLQVPSLAAGESSEHCYSGRVGMPGDSAATQENSSVSLEDELDLGSQKEWSGGDELDEDEPDAKRWRKEGESEGISGSGNRAVKETRVVVQTTSNVDLLDDGYKWRKYGQKAVKGNPNPRSYYKCTSAGCPVRKHVERPSHDLQSVITTYERTHNHDVPAARGAGRAASRPATEGANVTMAVRPSATAGLASHMTATSLFGGRTHAVPGGQTPFTLQMLQPSPASYGFPGFDTWTASYGNHEQN